MKTLIISGSFKPSLDSEGKSAARESALLVKRGFDDNHYKSYRFVDLREFNIPIYDGRKYFQYDSNTDLKLLIKYIDQSDIIVLAVPAYSCAVAGGFLNFINVMCGPLNEDKEGKNIFRKKQINFLVVGAAQEDAILGHLQLQKIFLSMEAILGQDDVIFPNPRNMTKKELMTKSKQAYNLGFKLSKY